METGRDRIAAAAALGLFRVATRRLRRFVGIATMHQSDGGSMASKTSFAALARAVLVTFPMLASAFFVLPLLAGEIHEAAAEGDLAKVKQLVAKNPKLVNLRSELGE